MDTTQNELLTTECCMSIDLQEIPVWIQKLSDKQLKVEIVSRDGVCPRITNGTRLTVQKILTSMTDGDAAEVGGSIGWARWSVCLSHAYPPYFLLFHQTGEAQSSGASAASASGKKSGATASGSRSGKKKGGAKKGRGRDEGRDETASPALLVAEGEACALAVEAPVVDEGALRVQAAADAAAAIEGDLGGSVMPSSACVHATVPNLPTELDIDAPCGDCGLRGENWVCVTCLKIFCGRYVNGHMMAHAQTQPAHSVCIRLDL